MVGDAWQRGRIVCYKNGMPEGGENKSRGQTRSRRFRNQAYETSGLHCQAGTPDHPCLIAYGNGRRMEAVKALEGMGIAQPAWWVL